MKLTLLPLLAVLLIPGLAAAGDNFNDRFNGDGSNGNGSFSNLHFKSAPAPAALQRTAGPSGSAAARAGTPHVIAGVFSEAKPKIPDFAGWTFEGVQDKTWMGTLERDMDKLTAEFDALKAQLPDAVESEIEIGGTVGKVNALLKKHELGIELQPTGNPKTVSVGVVMKLKDEWESAGASTSLTFDDGTVVKAARLKNPAFFENPGAAGQDKIVGLRTKQGLQVFMARFGKAVPHDATSVWKEALALDSGKRAVSPGDFEAVKFPKVSFNSKTDVDPIGSLPPGSVPLKNACAKQTKPSGAPYCVDQFVLQQLLKMDHLGFEATAGAAASFTPRGMVIEPKSYEIKGDFIVWVKVGNTIPFAAVITKKSMKDPKSP